MEQSEPVAKVERKHKGNKDGEQPGQMLRSRDGRTWYEVQKDGSWKKCPPNMAMMLSTQWEKEAAINKERAEAADRIKRLANPSASSQPSASSSEE